MASKLEGHRLWDRDNPDQQRLVADTPRYRDLLMENMLMLSEILRLDGMWPYFMVYNILTSREEQRLVSHVL